MNVHELNLFLTSELKGQSFLSFADSFSASDIVMLLPGLAALDTAPSLMNKIRGAFGAVLLNACSQNVLNRKPCDWQHVSAAEVFFGTRARFSFEGFDNEITKPFLLRAKTFHHAEHGQCLAVTLRLFGLARQFSDVAAFALASALAHHVEWQKLAKDDKITLPSKIIVADCSIKEVKSHQLTSISTSISLEFLSPIDNERADFSEAPQKIIERLVRRLISIGFWYQVDLRKEGTLLLNEPRWQAVLNNPQNPKKIGGHKRKNNLALLEEITLIGDINPLIPVLRLGEITNIGRGASLGLGEYRVLN